MTRPFRSSVILRIAGVIMGLISILGSIAALDYSDSREPYRYWLAALVMLLSGILWLASSFVSKYRLSKKHYVAVLAVILFGLIVGLIDVFRFCGGECGCFWYLGYPGRWLRMSTCVTGSTIDPIWMRHWGMDFPSFVADVVFWSGVGLMVAMIRDVVKRKKANPL